MCGLIAILSSGDDVASRESLVKQMLSVIAHRGPDGEGIHQISNSALFGHRRLAVIDLEHGDQPMLSDDQRYSLVFNGEIYNYLELRGIMEKQGVVFRTNSDTEVLLQLLIMHGKAAASQINGMFAFVFHDRQNDAWIAARDHFGIKPLYFTTAGHELIFASEIKALLVHPEVNAVRDDRALHQYLSMQFCLEDRTLFSGIRKIQPGHMLIGTRAEILQDICYWDTHYQIDEYHTEAHFTEELLALLNDSMRLQLRSDVPIGGYLSGGLDSSLVCSLAAAHLDSPLQMFHGRFAEGIQYDESQYAKILVDSVGGRYHDVVPTAEEFVRDLPGLIEKLDEPLAGPGVFPQYAVSKIASENVTVILGGQGGDEIFGGYARYLVGYLEQALKGAILETQEEGKHLVTLESIAPNLSLLKQYTPLLGNFWSKGLFEEMDARYFHLIDRSPDLNHLLHPDMLAQFDREQLFSDFQKVFNHPDTKSYINKMTHFDQKTLLPALLQIEDRVSMAVSLESRVPLLDNRIVDLVTSMPPPIKFQGGRTKHILKKTVGHLLPDAIKNRKDKMGFPVPLNEWMKGGIVRDFVGDTLLSQRSLNRGIYSPRALKSMLDHQGVGGRQLWGALSLELWHKRFIDVD
jgi:asparagine synthase (glutamine-hydrolysing)